ncbi:hypothetical protein [Lacticaseibacillus paracasei]|uniref:hypothetical protein n=1 Tax=Lacticaseibacillus paracasei TaxID=1597 RepID=UPI0018928DE8|nr:hypothetical protein [Lacticaseibacillus paracasei]QPC23077.1 hypothetical protein LacP0625_06235 [Lacticaseibacillus paracasei subsp. tolerans]
MKYRKKPVEIEAWHFTEENFQEGVPRWVDHLPVNKNGYEELNPNISLWSQYGGDKIGGEIRTLEGNMTISENDYIIKGVHGELYPCKPDIFEETYEPSGAQVDGKLLAKELAAPIKHEIDKRFRYAQRRKGFS